eukprot:954552-Amorphochlora_amoeboformis.AAC.1
MVASKEAVLRTKQYDFLKPNVESVPDVSTLKPEAPPKERKKNTQKRKRASKGSGAATAKKRPSKTILASDPSLEQPTAHILPNVPIISSAARTIEQAAAPAPPKSVNIDLLEGGFGQVSSSTADGGFGFGQEDEEDFDS